MRVDARRLVRGVGFAEQEADRFRSIVGRLHADELEGLTASVVPGKTAFRLEKHWIRRLRLELPLQHQPRRIVRGKLGANGFAMTGSFRVVEPGRNRQPLPDRVLVFVEHPRTDPPVLDRRINIGRIRSRPGYSGETKGCIGRPRQRAGLLAVFHDSRAAQREPRLIEGVEILEDQKCDRLAKIKRRFAQRTEQVAGVEFGNPRADARQIFSGDEHGRFQRAGQARQIESFKDVGCVGGADEHRVQGLRRPAGQIGGAEIRGVELRSGNLGDAIDATGPGGGRIEVLPARESFARHEVGLLRQSQRRNRKRNPARGE